MKKEKNQLLPLIVCCGINIVLTTTNIGLCIYNRTTPPIQENIEIQKEIPVKESFAESNIEISTYAGISKELDIIVNEALSNTHGAIRATTTSAAATPAALKQETKKKTYSKKDLEILAHVIMGEVGNQSYECKFYVGAVVLNRVKSSLYPDTIKGVVFQKGQYACTWDGNYDKTPNKECYKVAKDLLENGTGDVPVTVTGQSAVKQGKVWKAIKCTNGVTCYFCHNKWVIKEYEEKEAKKKSKKN